MTTITINGQAVEATRIDELVATVLHSREHAIPAMRDGLTARLTVAQILSLLRREDLTEKLFASDVKYEPDTASPIGADTVQDAIDEMVSLLERVVWRAKPLFEPFPLYIDPDVDTALLPPLPAESTDPRFIMLTANNAGEGEYNDGVLVNQSVTGSGALVQATAEIDYPASPKHGATIRLINTERRFLRAGVAGGSAEADALQNITGNFGQSYTNSNQYTNAETDGAFNLTDAASRTGMSGSGSVSGSRTVSFDASRVVRTADETRVKNLSVVYFMRIG